MAEGGRVHGGTSVWQNIRQALPFGLGAGANAAPAPPAAAARLVSGKAARADRAAPPPLERTSFGGEAAGAAAAAAAGGAPQPAGGDFGYPRGLERRFRARAELGRGANGVVTLVADARTGEEWACKSIPKEPGAGASELKRAGHAAAVKREVEVLRRLRGCLNVAALEAVFEDDTHVHLVMEACRGGELAARVGAAHYSERTAASYCRAALRTIAQCHAVGILHRDVKPGNFMLASDAPDAPLKAVDFGLAVFFEPGELPRRDLGFEGTPWFMAPEVLRSEVGPEADVWAAGVMAHQLLSGRMPFDDRSSPAAPAVSKIWRSVLLDKLDFTKPCWEGVSDDAKDFVSKLLEKDPAKRPSAREALKHPWLAGGIEERGRGRALGLSVVQRVQRYAAASAFKRSALELIAQELIADAEREHEEKENEEGGAATPAAAAAATPAAAAAATAARPAAACALGPDGRALVDGVDAGALEYLYARLRLADRAAVDRAALAGGLAELGYRLAPAEVERLLDALDPGQTGAVSRAGLAASQLDWRAVRSARAEAWLRGARAAFAGLDADADGRVSSEDMVALLRHKLPPSEIDAAVRQALAEGARREGGSAHGGSAGGSAHGGAGSAHGGAGSAGASAHGGAARGGAGAGAPPASPGDPSLRDGLNFRQFLRMLRSGASADSLDLYDDRFAGSASAHGAGGSGAGAGGARAALAAAASAGSPARSPGSYEHIDLLLERSVRAGSGAVGALAAPLGTLAEENGGDAPFD